MIISKVIHSRVDKTISKIKKVFYTTQHHRSKNFYIDACHVKISPSVCRVVVYAMAISTLQHSNFLREEVYRNIWQRNANQPNGRRRPRRSAAVNGNGI